MFGDDRLDASLRVAARALQILPCVIDLVLVERQLRLRELEAIRQPLHGRRRSFGDSRRELGDLHLIGGRRADCLAELVIEVRHLRGLHRMPGGWANLSFNAIAGPPMFAPLLFTAVGLLGFISSLLRHGEDR